LRLPRNAAYVPVRGLVAFTTGAGIALPMVHGAKVPVSNPPFTMALAPVVVLLKTIGVIAEPEQIVCDAGAADAFGVGLTSTVAVIDAPVHPLAVGVIVNVTVIGALVVLVSVPLILPLPLAAIPVTGTVLSLVQLKVVPATLPLSTIVVIGMAEHTVCAAGVATAFGVGLTNTVAVIGAPGQPLAVGVIVNVTVTGANVVLVNAPLILPEPLAAIPVTETVLSLVQLYVVPTTLPLSTIVVIVAAEQMVCDDEVATAFGVGLTVMVNCIGVPVQVTPLLV
jgi:hypothetical protein